MPPATRVSSRHHTVVQRCRQLARHPEPGVVLLDGEHVIADAITSGIPLECLLTDGRFPELVETAERAGVPIVHVTHGVLDAASPVRTPSGLVAIGRWQPAAVAATFEPPPAMVIGLCGVQDPGNLGSAIRAADALGATGVAALDDSADPAGWKALRGAMGSTFHVPVAAASSDEMLATARARGVQIVGAVAEDGCDPATIDLRIPTLMLLGREGTGLSPTLLRQAGVRASIPMRPRANSLNVAVTCALMLYEARRQRTGAA